MAIRPTHVTGRETLGTFDSLRRFVGKHSGEAALRQAFGEAMTARYDRVQGSLQEIIDLVGSGPSSIEPQTKINSNYIYLGKGENHNGKQGEYKAYLWRKDRQDSQRHQYGLHAVFTDANSTWHSSVDSVVQEFVAPYDFDRAESSGLGWRWDNLDRMRAQDKGIDIAEETVGMLWNAIRDPELNPEFAERALMLQRT